MANSKIIYGNTTLVDLTTDSATADKVMSGVTFMGKNGVTQTGTMEASGASVSGTTISVGGMQKTASWSSSSASEIAEALADYRSGNSNYPVPIIWSWYGQERQITLTDGTVVTYIFEGNEYDLVDTSLNYKGLTIVPKYVQYSAYIRNDHPSDLYWYSSDNGMRNFVNGTYYNKFPSDFKALLKQFQSWGGANDWFCVPSSDQYGVKTNKSGTAQNYATTQFYHDWNPEHIYYVNTSGGISHGVTSTTYGAFPIGCI